MIYSKPFNPIFLFDIEEITIYSQGTQITNNSLMQIVWLYYLIGMLAVYLQFPSFTSMHQMMMIVSRSQTEAFSVKNIFFCFVLLTWQFRKSIEIRLDIALSSYLFLLCLPEETVLSLFVMKCPFFK